MIEKIDNESIDIFLNENTVDRIRYLEMINNLLEKNEGIRLGINGKWGSGKTVLAKMIYNLSHYIYNGYNTEYFDNNLPYIRSLKTIYFDASKEDIFDNALLSLARVISDELDQHNSFEKSNLFKGVLEIFGAFSLTSPISKVAQGFRTISEMSSEFDELLNTNKIIHLIEKCFNPNDKYLIMIDELDRCDPKYALRLLVTLKHFFSLENVQIILFYNYDELWNLISHEYGYKDPNYLQKYVDYEIDILDENDNYARSVFNAKHYFNSKMIAYFFYNLTLREINNLEFLVKCFPVALDNFHVLLATHVKVKRLPIETFNEVFIEKKMKLLKSFDGVISIERIKTDLLDKLSRISVEEMNVFLSAIY